MSLLLVEQYIGHALGLADRVYLLDRGQVSWSGPPHRLDEDELVKQYLHVGSATRRLPPHPVNLRPRRAGS